jgi:hypothetical protein
LREEEEVVVSNWETVFKMQSRCKRHVMKTEKCFQNAKQMHRDMVMKTENCFQNAEQMHRDMEVKTENCFQNAEQMHRDMEVKTEKSDAQRHGGENRKLFSK